jgi:exosortase/archaeosortase family protein
MLRGLEERRDLAVPLAHFSFRPFWKKVLFVGAGLLVMLLKNGVRIATLSLLANYVDFRFLGSLHHPGGVFFFLFGLSLLLPLYWWFKKGEIYIEEKDLEADTRAALVVRCIHEKP